MMDAVIDIAGSTATHQLTGVQLPGADTVADVTIADGRIAAIESSTSPAGRVLLPLMADAHVHLDKTYSVSRTGSGARSLFEAIEQMDKDKVNWTTEDIFERASQALERAWRHGVAAMRSHVDWSEPDTPLAWDVLCDLRTQWRGRVDLQLASLSPVDLLSEVGAVIATRVKADGGVLGAFVYRNGGLKEKVANVFDLAERYDLALDFHVDEGLEPEAQGFDQIVMQAGMRPDSPPVLCGHACSLSVRPDEEVRTLLGQAAQANVGLVVLPTTNSYLQDNTPGRTPRMRGIAPVQEAAAAGVDVIIASDNVRDVFYPYGDYDLFDVFRSGIQMAHLSPIDWLPAISHRAAGHCGTDKVVDLLVGQPANFIEITAPDLEGALSVPNAPRKIWRDGKVIQ